MINKRYYLLLVLLFLSPIASAENSAQGQTMTKFFEGWRSMPYEDTEGVKTIGYGFHCGYVDCSRMMKREDAEKIFEAKYKEAELRAIRFLGQNHWTHLQPSQKRVLIDMSYNLGNRLFSFKKFRKALCDGDIPQAVIEMRESRWYQQTGRRAKALIEIMEASID